VGSEFVVSGPFEAGVRVDGGEVRGGLADLSLGLLRRCEPVRVPGVYRRQRHMPGRWFPTTAGRFLEYESLLERDWMLLMDFDREVEWICEQPLRLRYVKDGRLASHVPDLFAWRQGVPELCDVKSEERVDDPTFRVRVVAGGGMTGSRWPLSVGGRLMVDGEAITVTTVDGREVKGVTGRGEPVQFVLTRVEDSPSAVVDKGEWRFGQVLLDAGALCDGQLREAAELLAHLNEASFGYRSGDPADRRYQQLLRHAEQARTAAGFATANLTRALASPPGQ
jgi:hypothetical protein